MNDQNGGKLHVTCSYVAKLREAKIEPRCRTQLKGVLKICTLCNLCKTKNRLPCYCVFKIQPNGSCQSVFWKASVNLLQPSHAENQVVFNIIATSDVFFFTNRFESSMKHQSILWDFMESPVKENSWHNLNLPQMIRSQLFYLFTECTI